MKSPFPGMDPYLENHWGDVHHNLITFMQGALNDQMPDGLVARAEERVFLESEGTIGRSLFPDVRVIERRPTALAPEPEGGVAVAEPLSIHCPAPEPLTEGFLEIIDVESGNRLVTVIEVHSPSIKMPGAGQKLYLQKQWELLQSDTNLVEIDLLRAGQQLLVPIAYLPKAPAIPYAICVHRAARPGIRDLYLVALAQRLPRLSIPLRATDADIALDLQPLIEQCYRNARYDLTIKYQTEPEPPLSADDAKWADELLRTSGKR